MIIRSTIASLLRASPRLTPLASPPSLLTRRQDLTSSRKISKPWTPHPVRTYASSPTADALMENLTDLYATARDEFEIAAEETTKKTVYAADDRAAAAEALAVLKSTYEKAVREASPEVGREIQGRVGQRIRELESAIKNMEESAMED